jgi:hypothetical protein
MHCNGHRAPGLNFPFVAYLLALTL